MLHYPHMDPIALEIGPLKVHWYGLMYLFGFLSGWFLGVYRAKKPYSPIKPEQVGDVIFYISLGVVLGGRLGYVIFYNFDMYMHNPISIFYVWDGGMSFHGGFIGVLIAFYLYSKKYVINFFDLAEFFAPMVPIGLGAGRIGNFINGELWGRVTTSPIGMVFPTGGPLPRYPSQLIEFFLEGVVLFTVLWCTTIKPKPRFYMFGMFLTLYGLFRIIAEHFRQPDPQLGYILFNCITMGQILSIPMVIAGIIFLRLAYKNSKKAQ